MFAQIKCMQNSDHDRVFGGFSDVAKPKEDVLLHFIPLSGDERPVGQVRQNGGLKMGNDPKLQRLFQPFAEEDFCIMFAGRSSKNKIFKFQSLISPR